MQEKLALKTLNELINRSTEELTQIEEDLLSQIKVCIFLNFYLMLCLLLIFFSEYQTFGNGKRFYD